MLECNLCLIFIIHYVLAPSRSSLGFTTGLLWQLQEGLLPLPLIGLASRHPKLHQLSKKVRKRVEVRAAVDHELNHAIKEINGLGKGLLGRGRDPRPP